MIFYLFLYTAAYFLALTFFILYLTEASLLSLKQTPTHLVQLRTVENFKNSQDSLRMFFKSYSNVFSFNG